MFITFLLSICCLSIVLSGTIDQNSNGNLPTERQFTIKSIGVTYTQYLTNYGQCTVEWNGQEKKSHPLTEGEIIEIKGKLFKVEDCQLNRAYAAACGSQLFHQMRDIVCSHVEQTYGKKILKRRQASQELIDAIDRSYYDVCCKSACTVSEFTRYCPSKW